MAVHVGLAASELAEILFFLLTPRFPSVIHLNTTFVVNIWSFINRSKAADRVLLML